MIHLTMHYMRHISITVVDSDLSESSDSPGPRKYSLRQKKPTVDRFQANVEPVRRSIRALRSVLSNSMRRRKHRSKSTSSSDSSDSEPQRYDKKKGKKARYVARKFAFSALISEFLNNVEYISSQTIGDTPRWPPRSQS